jgi:hypothetical protein
VGKEGDFAWFTAIDGIVAQGMGGCAGGAGSSAQLRGKLAAKG